MEKIEEKLTRDYNDIFQKFKNAHDAFAIFAHFNGIANIMSLFNMLNLKQQLHSENFHRSYEHSIERVNDYFFYKNYEDFRKCFNFTYTLLENTYNIYDEICSGKKIIESSSFINTKDLFNIAYDFLDWYNPEYKKILVELSKQSRIIIGENKTLSDNLCGKTLYSYDPNSVYIYISNFNNIVTSSCIAHEITHAYFLQKDLNHPYKKLLIRDFNTTGEIASYTTELFFLEYLKKIKFAKDDIQFLGQDFDYYLMQLIACWLKEFEDLEKINVKNYKKIDSSYIADIRDFYGKIIAYYLYSLDDKEKVFYLLDKIHEESTSKSIIEILNNNQINIDEIMKCEYSRKLIESNWG